MLISMVVSPLSESNYVLFPQLLISSSKQAEKNHLYCGEIDILGWTFVIHEKKKMKKNWEKKWILGSSPRLCVLKTIKALYGRLQTNYSINWQRKEEIENNLSETKSWPQSKWIRNGRHNFSHNNWNIMRNKIWNAIRKRVLINNLSISDGI